MEKPISQSANQPISSNPVGHRWNQPNSRRRFLKGVGGATVGVLASQNFSLAENEAAGSLDVTDFTYDVDFDCDDDGKICKINSLNVSVGNAAWWHAGTAPADLMGNWDLLVAPGYKQINGKLTGDTESAAKLYGLTGLSLQNVTPEIASVNLDIIFAFTDQTGQIQDGVTKPIQGAKFTLTVANIKSKFTPHTENQSDKFELLRANSQLKLTMKGGPGPGNSVNGSLSLNFTPNSGVCSNPPNISIQLNAAYQEHDLTDVINAWYQEYGITSLGAEKLSSVKATVTFTPSDPHWKPTSISFTVDCDNNPGWEGDENYKFNKNQGNWINKLGAKAAVPLWNLLATPVMKKMRAQALSDLKDKKLLLDIQRATIHWLTEAQELEYVKIILSIDEIENHADVFDQRNLPGAMTAHEAGVIAHLKASFGEYDKVFGFTLKAKETNAVLSELELTPHAGPSFIEASGAVYFNFAFTLAQVLQLGGSLAVNYNAKFTLELKPPTSGAAGLKMVKTGSELTTDFNVAGKSEATFVTSDPMRIVISNKSPIKVDLLNQIIIPESTVTEVTTEIDKVTGTTSKIWGGDNDGRMAVKIKPKP